MFEDNFSKSCNPEDSVKKRLQRRCFPVKLAKYLRTSTLTKQLRWLLLTFNSYFQRIPEQKLVRLLAINTRFSWKKVFAVAKTSNSVRKIIPEFIYPFFSVLSFLNFCFLKFYEGMVLSCNKFCQDILIIKNDAVQISSKMLSFFHRWDYCWKSEFDTDVKYH